MDYNRLFESVKKHEGFVPSVYKDIYGFDTFGYGTCVKDLELTEDMAAVIMEMALLKIAVNCFSRYSWLSTCPTVIQEVVVEMCYQMGIEGFSQFRKMIGHLEEGSWKKAAKEGLNSKWARQDSPDRAKELMDRIRSLG